MKRRRRGSRVWSGSGLESWFGSWLELWSEPGMWPMEEEESEF